MQGTDLDVLTSNLARKTRPSERWIKGQPLPSRSSFWIDCTFVLSTTLTEAIPET